MMLASRCRVGALKKSGRDGPTVELPPFFTVVPNGSHALKKQKREDHGVAAVRA
jgi:hypothetical protein